MAENKDPLWIEHANLDKGALGRKAKAAGQSTQGFAKKNEGSPGKLGKQSRLAETLSKLRGKGFSDGSIKLEMFLPCC